MASNTINVLESNGLSAVMMEDQKRPRRCGHFEGKEILPVKEYVTEISFNASLSGEVKEEPISKWDTLRSDPKPFRLQVRRHKSRASSKAAGNRCLRLADAF